MNAESLPPRALDRTFWFKIGAAVLLLALALFPFGDGTGHPIYDVVLAIFAFVIGARVVAEYTANRFYRDVSMVLTGIAVGIILTPLLLRFFAA